MVGYSSLMSLRPPASRSSKPATVGRGNSSRRWLPALVLLLAVLVASLTLGRALRPGAATPRVVQGTTTAVAPTAHRSGSCPTGTAILTPRRRCVSA